MSLRETPIDPSPSSALIQRAFLLEAFLNLCSFPLFTHTHTVLSFILLDPSQITPATILFTRFFSAVVLGGLTPPLILGARNTREGIESRSRTYILLGLGEVLMIPLLVAEAAGGGNGKGKALSTKAALAGIGMLLPPLVWRVWVGFFRPGRFGSVMREKKA
jgi:hypothetical protein